jgi:hypothetical protein
VESERVRLIKAQGRMMVGKGQGGGGRRNTELVNGYKISVMHMNKF